MPERTAPLLAAIATLLVVSLSLMLAGLDGTPFRGLYDDVDRALIARNMADGGDWLVADYLGRPLHTKPPLMYWTAGLLYEITGRRDEFPARLASVFGMAILVLGTAHFGWRMRDLATGLRAGLLLVTMHLFLAMARQPLIDTVMLAGLGAALVALAEILAGPPARRRRWWLLLAAAAGWSLMTKGPVLLPVLALICGPAMIGRGGIRPGLGTAAAMIGVVLLVVLPWHAAMFLRSPEYFAVWRTEILGRFAGSDAFLEWTQKPWWFYGPDLVNTLPWLGLWLVGVVLAWRRRRDDRWSMILLWWAIGGLVFYTVASATKRSYYLLPLYPAFALLAADAWRASLAGGESALPRRAFAAVRVATTAVALGLGAGVVATAAAGVVGWGWAIAGATAIAGAIAWARRGRSPWRGLDALLLPVIAALLMYHAAIVPPLHAYRSGKPFYEEARQRIAAEPAAPLVISGVPLAITAFYLRTQDFHNTPPQYLPAALADSAPGWLVTHPTIARGIPGLETVVERTQTPPYGQGSRSLGLYRFGSPIQAVDRDRSESAQGS